MKTFTSWAIRARAAFCFIALAHMSVLPTGLQFWGLWICSHFRIQNSESCSFVLLPLVLVWCLVIMFFFRLETLESLYIFLNKFPFFLSLHFLYLSCVHVPLCSRELEDNLWESLLCFQHRGSGLSWDPQGNTVDELAFRRPPS